MKELILEVPLNFGSLTDRFRCSRLIPFFSQIAISVLFLYLEKTSYFSWLNVFMPKYFSFSQAARTKTRAVHTGHKEVIADTAMWTTCQRTAQRPVANANGTKSLHRFIFNASDRELNRSDLIFHQPGFQKFFFCEGDLPPRLTIITSLSDYYIFNKLRKGRLNGMISNQGQ